MTDTAQFIARISALETQRAALIEAVEMFTGLWPVIDGDIKATPSVKAAWRAGLRALAQARGKETCKHGFDVDFSCRECAGQYS